MYASSRLREYYTTVYIMVDTVQFYFIHINISVLRLQIHEKKSRISNLNKTRGGVGEERCDITLPSYPLILILRSDFDFLRQRQ